MSNERRDQKGNLDRNMGSQQADDQSRRNQQAQENQAGRQPGQPRTDQERAKQQGNATAQPGQQRQEDRGRTQQGMNQPNRMQQSGSADKR